MTEKKIPPASPPTQKPPSQSVSGHHRADTPKDQAEALAGANPAPANDADELREHADDERKEVAGAKAAGARTDMRTVKDDSIKTARASGPLPKVGDSVLAGRKGSGPDEDDEEDPATRLRKGLAGGRFLMGRRTPIHMAEISELKSQLSQGNKEACLRIASEMLHKLTSPQPRKLLGGKDVHELSSAELEEFDSVCGECLEHCTPLSRGVSGEHADTPGMIGIDWNNITMLIQMVLQLLAQFKK